MSNKIRVYILVIIAFGLSFSISESQDYESLEINESIFEKDSTSDYSSPFFDYQGYYRQKYGQDVFGDADTLDGYSYESEIDSTGERVLATERVDDLELSSGIDMSLDQYLNFRKNMISYQIWDSLLTDYDIKKALSSRDLARLMADATGISIPIPPNPLMGIFGKPQININVNGEVNLRLGWRWDSQNLGTVSAFGQTQSTPIFSQDIRVNVSGGIGDKLRLSTDWNTNRTFGNDNQFKVGYEGYEDDIIKLVEFGNVSLPLNSQLITGGQTLFGVRSDYQFGPLYLRTIFAQRRGERNFVDVRGGSNKEPFQIRPPDFAQNHFFLDNDYKAVYKDYWRSPKPVIPQSANFTRVKDIEVWESTNTVTSPQVSEVIAYATLPPEDDPLDFINNAALNNPNVAILAGSVERGRFQKLDTNQYIVDRNLGTLTVRNLRQDRKYAVSYITEGPTSAAEDDLYHGTFSNSVDVKDTLILKLVSVPNLQPGFDTLWSRQMKNIYSLGKSNLNLDETTISIWYLNQDNDSVDVLPNSPDKLVTIFGVDRTNTSGAAQSDGEFDKTAGSPFFNQQTGEIIFPSIEPFRGGLIDYFAAQGTPSLADQYIFSDIYDTVRVVAERNTARNRFIIGGEISGSSNGKISLGAFNLSPGSVRVFLDGRQLREFQDYVVDYFSGTLTLRNASASAPGANLKVEYEQQDLLQIATKTLAGVRGDYLLVDKRRATATLSFTFMHYNIAAINDRVQLGNEPISNTIFGLDGNLQWDTPWLTKALDFLPFYETKAESNITIGGEMAIIFPTPNKKESTIASDNGEAAVDLDNFEGGERSISLGLNPSQWQFSSPPLDSSIGDTPQDRNFYRGRLSWFKYFIPRVPVRDVYPDQQTTVGNRNIAPMELAYEPYFRGIYNRNAEYLDSLNPEYDASSTFLDRNGNRQRVWAGMQRLLSSFNTNFDTENIEYLELMLQIDQKGDLSTEMYIDLGQISEDIIANSTLDTEDGITEDNPLPNNRIDEGEDVGIDALDDELEQEDYPFPLNLEEDPARDNYFFDFGKDDGQRTSDDFLDYNNFEGNASQSELGQFPDKEILNDNNGQTITLDNSYFRYKIDISNLDPNTNPQIVGGNQDAGWFQFRIPIRRPSGRVGNPLFSNVQYIRVSFKGGPAYIKVADWKLVGSQWQRISNFLDVPENDSVMSLSFVNRFENKGAPDFYTMPPGVRPPRQLNSPNNEDLELNEQSIALTVDNLGYGEERMATRVFRSMDLFYYKKLKFFYHGDGSMPGEAIPGVTPKGYAFIRFGTDSSNYYEYRKPITRGWTDVQINLEELTAIKQIRDTSLKRDRQEFAVPGDPTAVFAVKGSPVVTRVSFIGLGIANPEERYPNDLTTTVWFNELRLTKPEASSDIAAIASSSVKLADLGTIDASFRTQEPNFHRLEERFGNRMQTTKFTINMQGQLNKFMPESFKGVNLPISYTHTEKVETPEFQANNDVNLDVAANLAKERALDNGATEDEAQEVADALVKRSQTLVVQDSWGMNGVKLGLPINHWTVNETLNKLVLGYNYTQEYQRTPVYEQKFNWEWRADVRYTNRIPELLSVQPFTWSDSVPVLETYSEAKYNFLPNAIGFGLNVSRQRRTEQSRFLDFASPVVRDFTANRTANFSWKFVEGGFLNPLLDYNFSTRSSLVRFEAGSDGTQRTGSELAKTVLLNDGALINFGDDINHTQNVTLNFTPQLPNIANINKYFKITGQYVVDYQWTNPLHPDPALLDVAKQANYNSTTRFTGTIGLEQLGNSWFGTGGKTSLTRQIPKDTSTSFWSELGSAFKFIFLDFKTVRVGLNQTNSSINPGVYGGTGLTNFWGFGNSSRPQGPSLPYQLGLVSSPHGGFKATPSAAFPFIGFEAFDGLRPPNAILQDNFNQATTFDIATSRPLWKGAELDLKWNSTVSYNRNETVLTDNDGVPTYTNVIALKSFSRSYMSFPTIFGFNPFGNTMDAVVEEYNNRAAAIENSGISELEQNRAKQRALSESFFEELEAFSISGGAARKFLPAPNYGITWEGLEEWGIWSDYVKKVRFEHRYQALYDEAIKITDKGEAYENQMVQYGFQPMLGVTWTFDDEKLDGQLTANLRWNSTSNFNLSSSSRSIIEKTSTNEISAQANYTMKSLEWEFLGLSLENNIEYSFLFSIKDNSRATFDVSDEAGLNENEGRELQGDTQITIEPRIRYSLSNRVTASFFFRYDATVTAGAANPGFSTTQVGLDLRISLAGGR
jgi:cell surface protein SprA